MPPFRTLAASDAIPRVQAADAPRRRHEEVREEVREALREAVREAVRWRRAAAEARARFGAQVCRGVLTWAIHEFGVMLADVEQALAGLEGAMALYEVVEDPSAGSAVEDGGVPIALSGMRAAQGAWFGLVDFTFVARALHTGVVDRAASRVVRVPESDAPPSRASVDELRHAEAVAERVKRDVDQVVEQFYDYLAVGEEETFARVSARIAAEGATRLARKLCRRAEFLEQRVDDLNTALSCLGQGVLDE